MNTRMETMDNVDTGKESYRTEEDSIGTKAVPEGVYYGVQSLRAAENFRITGLNMHPEIINSLAEQTRRNHKLRSGNPGQEDCRRYCQSV